MRTSDPRSWMWSEAIEMLEMAERLHRDLFRPRGDRRSRAACWEPPADIFDAEDAVTVVVALPGVEPASVTARIADGELAIFGERSAPRELQTGSILRLEIPQGCFERRLPIPPGVYGDVKRSFANGCLIVRLLKSEGGRAQ